MARTYRVCMQLVLRGFFLMLCLLVFLGIGTYVIYSAQLTSKERIMNNNDTGITLLDANNTPFFTFYQAQNKTFVPLKKISPHVKMAVVAVEDKDFYVHKGFSLKGI